MSFVVGLLLGFAVGTFATKWYLDRKAKVKQGGSAPTGKW